MLACKSVCMTEYDSRWSLFLSHLYSFIFDQELRCAPLNYVGVAIIITRSSQSQNYIIMKTYNWYNIYTGNECRQLITKVSHLLQLLSLSPPLCSALMLMFVRSDGKNQPNSRLTIQSTKSVLDNSIDTLLSNRPVSFLLTLSPRALSLSLPLQRETKDWVEKLGAWPRRVL